MPMSHNERSDFILIFQQIGDIGHNKVNTRQVLIRKLGATIDNDNILIVLDEIHVFPDFINTA
ncbi:hypothetical protein D3C71_2200450 [compost metagenome]